VSIGALLFASRSLLQGEAAAHAELERFNAETRDEGYVEVNSPQLTH
jgi:hypothetical protein